MNCAEFESLLADYLDGTLTAELRSAVLQHVERCSGCAEYVADVRAGMAALEATPEVQTPPELVTRIAFQVPAGKIRSEYDKQGFFSRLTSNWLRPVLQPRFAMGMAMTILSFAMLERCTGVRVQEIRPIDLDPVHVLDEAEGRVLRIRDRAVKYYENIRLVYQVESQLKLLQSQRDSADAQARQHRTKGQEEDKK